MTTGLKIWFWIVLIVNVGTCVWEVLVALIAPLVWISVGLTMLVVLGTAMLLFARKKMGYYVICSSAVLGLIVKVCVGFGIVNALVSSVVMPLITGLLMVNTWHEFR